MLKQSVNLKLGQNLTMTPALQQAIRLLQLSTVELQLEIQQQLESNIMLETDEADEADAAVELESLDSNKDSVEAVTDPSAELDLNTQNSAEPNESRESAELADRWNEEPSSSGSASVGAELPDAGDLGDTQSSLREHLLEQLQFERFSDRDRIIALAIIDSLGDDGYLLDSDASLIDSLALEFPLEPIEADEFEAVLHRIQRLDPIGVACRDLRECLLLQLQITEISQQFEADALALAKRVLTKHFELLSKRNFPTLSRRLRCSEVELRAAIEVVQTLNPRPGHQIESQSTEYITPDVYVHYQAGRWQVSLNPGSTPALRINSYYESLTKKVGSSSDAESLRNHLQEARWFIKSLQARNETLMKVAHCIVEQQQQYFEQGDVAMKPMVLRTVAEQVEMHESTISRVTTRKYMHTPNGIVEFKHFFSSHVGTSDGGEMSATAIQAMIKKLVAEENSRKPLSDSKLATELQNNGINVARRTIAKYREALGIGSSTERKQIN